MTEWCQRYLPYVVNPRRILQKIWGVSCTVYRPGKRLWIDSNSPTVEMETRNTIAGYFGSEFPAICNHCGVMAAWSCKTLKNYEKFLAFFGKPTLMVKFSKFCFESYHCDIDRRVVLKFPAIWSKGNWWNRALLTRQKKQNFVWLSSCRYCADCAQNLPGPAPDNVLRVLQISSKSVHFCKVNPIFDWSLASSRIKNYSQVWSPPKNGIGLFLRK